MLNLIQNWRFLVIGLLFLIVFLSSSTPTLAQVVEKIDLGSGQTMGVKPTADNNPGNIVSRAVTILMIVGALGSLFMVVWGGIDWIFSGGDKEKLASARKKITTALIGLAVLALSFFILNVFGKIVFLNPLANFQVPGLGTGQSVF